MSASAWVLCVLLDYREPSSAVCEPKPDHETCVRDMQDWLSRWYAWQKRSVLNDPILVACVPLRVRTP